VIRRPADNRGAAGRGAAGRGAAGRTRPSGDAGSESVELALLLPVVLSVLALIVVGARVALAGERVSGVASSAARAASLSRSAGTAQTAAEAGARAALEDANLHCTSTAVTVDTSGFTTGAGVPGAVRVTVSCTVSLASIGISGLPGSRTLTDTAVSPLDPLRDTR